MAVATPVATVELQCVCRTEMGEKVSIAGSSFEFGQWSLERMIDMVTSPDSYPVWTATVEVMLQEGAARHIEFKHVLVPTSGPPRWEEGPNRELVVEEAAAHEPLRCFTLFGDTSREDRGCYSVRSPPRRSGRSGLPPTPRCHLFWDITCPETKVGDRLKVVGPLKELGAGDVHKGLELVTDAQCFPRWHASTIVELWNAMGPTSIEYKLVVIRGDAAQTLVDDSIIRTRKISRGKKVVTVSSAFRVCGGEDRPVKGKRSSRRHASGSSEDTATAGDDSASDSSNDSGGETDPDMPEMLPMQPREAEIPTIKRRISGHADWFHRQPKALRSRA